MADYWRAHYRRAAAHSLEAFVEAGSEDLMVGEGSILSASATAERVQAILQSLPARYCEVLTYRFLLGLSVRGTALSMGVTEINVKVMQFRALKRAADLDAITNRCLMSKS